MTLRREGRSVIVPRTTLVDTRAPRPRVKRILPGPIVGPEAVPVQIEVGSVSRRLTKRGRVWRTDDGEPRVVAELGPVEDTRTLVWDGRVDGAPAPPGIYLVEVTARDRAANLGPRRARSRRGAPAARPPRADDPRDRRRGAAAAGHGGPEAARQRRRPRAPVPLAAAPRRPHEAGGDRARGPRASRSS